MQTQLQRFYEYLTQGPATATMVSMATGIPQKNICRYKRKLEKDGMLVEITVDTCEVTGRDAAYLLIR